MLAPVMAALVLLVAPLPASAVSVCGETVAANTTGVLANDLTCAGPVAVSLDSRATLDMNGHVITVTAAAASAISCLRNACAVISSGAPGELVSTAANQVGIFAAPGDGVPGAPPGRVRRLDVTNVALQGFLLGILAGESKVFATDVTASSCARAGIAAAGLHVENVTASDGGLDGILVERRVRGSGLTTNNNTYGIRNAAGRVSLSGFTATGNQFGIAVSRVRLVDSDVRGNTDWDIGAFGGRPVLIDTLCDHSRDLRGGVPPDTPWGVCALD